MITCWILLILNHGAQVRQETWTEATGRILGQDRESYLVDFSHSLDAYNLSGNASDYNNFLVFKANCREH